jgi:hypothetical protein
MAMVLVTFAETKVTYELLTSIVTTKRLRRDSYQSN